MHRWINLALATRFRYPKSPLAQKMQGSDLSHPLSRASQMADSVRSMSSETTRPQKPTSKWNSLPSRYYLLPKVPRPKRSVLYYSTWTKPKRNLRLPHLKFSHRLIYTANQRIRSKTRNLHMRFFSKEARAKRRQRRHFIRWWTLTSLTVVVGGMAAKMTYERGEQEQNGFNEYAIKPQSWHLYAYSTLPLKAISRLWGQFNSIDLPVWMRAPSYRLYSTIFGVNLEEMEEPDLTTYSNLSEFFYRTLRPGARPIADADVVSPSDGKVLKFGAIENGEIEQVKGMTYSIDALLGSSNTRLAAPSHSPAFEHDDDDATVLQRDEEFAKINGISYSVDDLVGGENDNTYHMNELEYQDKGDGTAAGSKSSVSQELSVAKKLVPTSVDNLKASSDKQLYFAVIYLAPGDYHRFHSPTNWVTTLRRHFIGELFSVAPFFQRTLRGLFVLNERVALLGYWKYGFFSMIPVGATNVGSIIVNFDKDLKTNDKYEHSIYLRSEDSEKTPLLQSDEESLVGTLYSDETTSSKTSSKSSKPKKLKKNTVYEATYSRASRLLGGYPLVKGQEVGGFKLGSTVVLVFEAPSNFQFNLSQGQQVKMGQKIGGIVDEVD